MQRQQRRARPHHFQGRGGIAEHPPADFRLVDPAQVGRLLGSPHAPRSKLLEAHFTSIDHPPIENDPRHIPGAIQVHPSYLESGTDAAKYYPHYDCPEDGNLLPDDELQLALRRLGITPDTLVVVYGTEPDGAMAAARVVWGLMYAGVKRVRLLDGGMNAWRAHGGATVARIPAASDMGRSDDHVVPAGSVWRVRPELLATTGEVGEIIAAPGSAASRLVDVRDAGEWDGTDRRHYTFFSEAGRIPNAVYQGDWDSLLDSSTCKLGPRLESVARRWREQGILDAAVERRRTTLIFYCGTGWRSSAAFLVAWLLGLRAKNYDDGFYGWSRRAAAGCGYRADSARPAVSA